MWNWGPLPRSGALSGAYSPSAAAASVALLPSRAGVATVGGAAGDHQLPGDGLGGVGDLRARGPAPLRDVTGWGQSVSGGFSLGFYPLKCALSWSFYDRLWGTMLLPLFLAALCLLATLPRRGGRGGDGPAPGGGHRGGWGGRLVEALRSLDGNFLLGCTILIGSTSCSHR